MPGFGFVVAIGAVWMGIGVVLAVVMGRRGHSSFGWLVLGAVLGPLAVVLAIDAWGHSEELEPDPVGSQGRVRRGPVDVLVGFDGSPESAAAADAVVELFAERVGRLTVATVVPYSDARPDVASAADALRRLAARTPDRPCDLEILHGHPAAALIEYAAAGGYDVIAAGTRAGGITDAILGSAATELARDSKVPVLLVGAPVRQAPREAPAPASPIVRSAGDRHR